jgi:cytidine deaminase
MKKAIGLAWLICTAVGLISFTAVVGAPDKGPGSVRVGKGERTAFLSEADASRQMAQEGLTVQELMLKLLPAARDAARPVVSRYRVGAVCRGLSGGLYYGANIELQGLPLSFTVHAEQAAVINAYHHGETGISHLAVTAAPCGRCRQFLNELSTAGTLHVILPGKPSRLLKEYLPDAFGPGDLGIEGGFMYDRDHGLHVDPSDPLAAAACRAASRSYAPYTASYSGVAIQAGHQVFAGAYVENAAYNPSLSPFQAALTLLVMSGAPYAAVTDVVLVETRNPVISQISAVKIMLSAIAPAASLRVAKGH